MIHDFPTYHALHEADKTPEGDSVILHDCINGCEQIAHALNVAQVTIIFIVSQKHILHLFQVNVCAHVSKWRFRIWMRDIFPFKKGNMPIRAVNIFFYMSNPEK